MILEPQDSVVELEEVKCVVLEREAKAVCLIVQAAGHLVRKEPLCHMQPFGHPFHMALAVVEGQPQVVGHTLGLGHTLPHLGRTSDLALQASVENELAAVAVGTADMDAQDAWDVDDKVALDTVVGRVVPDHADQDTVVGRVVSDHADRVQVEVDPVAEMVGHSAVHFVLPAQGVWLAFPMPEEERHLFHHGLPFFCYKELKP